VVVIFGENAIYTSKALEQAAHWQSGIESGVGEVSDDWLPDGQQWSATAVESVSSVYARDTLLKQKRAVMSTKRETMRIINFGILFRVAFSYGRSQESIRVSASELCRWAKLKQRILLNGGVHVRFYHYGPGRLLPKTEEPLFQEH